MDSHPRLFLFLGSEFPITKRRAKYNSGASGADVVSHLSLLLSPHGSARSRRRTRLPGTSHVVVWVWNPQDALPTRW